MEAGSGNLEKKDYLTDSTFRGKKNVKEKGGKMDEKRKGKIAWALLKYRVFREGIRLTPDMKRELGNVAKATGIPLDELKEFGRILIKELLEETFGK